MIGLAMIFMVVGSCIVHCSGKVTERYYTETDPAKWQKDFTRANIYWIVGNLLIIISGGLLFIVC